ncbi:MAG: hypothetical protein J7K63_09995 [Candidatus Marinimicrobia bacterium]|nr:hypothetical protein [Candidatus Neomarinimicrobiota bacterium]
MNLPVFLETLPVNPFVKGILTILISGICMILFFFLIVYYRQISNRLICRKKTGIAFQLKSLFTNSLYNNTTGRNDAVYKIQLPVSLLFLVYLFLFPVPQEHSFVFITLYGTVMLFLYFLLFLSSKDSVLRYFFLKRIRILFEYFFLLFFLVLILGASDPASVKVPFLSSLIIVFRAFLVIVLFINLWVIRHTFSLDMYLIQQPWFERLSENGKIFCELCEQVSGFLLLSIFLTLSIRNGVFMAELLNRSGLTNPLILYMMAFFAVILLDFFQRRLMTRYSWPDEEYLIRLNNKVLLPVLMVTAIALVMI